MTRAVAILVALAIPGAALAQEAPAEPAAAPAPAPAAAPAPAPADAAKAPADAPKPAAEAAPAVSAQNAAAAAAALVNQAKPAKPDQLLALSSRTFYTALLEKNVEILAQLCKAPFFFEGRAVGTDAEMKARWSNLIGGEPLEGVSLYDIELLSLEEMTQKYGKPPDRLRAWSMQGAIFSVANLSGHATVVMWRKFGDKWLALGFHD